MITRITHPNLLQRSDFLCFLFMNYYFMNLTRFEGWTYKGRDKGLLLKTQAFESFWDDNLGGCHCLLAFLL